MKSYTDLEQSKKLAEILPLESADYFHAPDAGIVVTEPYKLNENDETVITAQKGAIPCWSLAALRNLLPTAIKPNKDTYLFESHNTFDNSWVYRYYNEDDISYLYYKNTNEIDACYEMIIKLNELNLL